MKLLLLGLKCLIALKGLYYEIVLNGLYCEIAFDGLHYPTTCPRLLNTYIKFGKKNGMKLSYYPICFTRFYQSFGQIVITLYTRKKTQL